MLYNPGRRATAIDQGLLWSALLLAAIGLLSLLRRGHWMTTLLFASAFLALAAVPAGVIR